uniref:Uncharacterized protein n=1 Tax=Anguilla anguilla TaxID=7936 RepID=A0A0E9UMK4_ANGAN
MQAVSHLPSARFGTLGPVVLLIIALPVLSGWSDTLISMAGCCSCYAFTQCCVSAWLQ